MIFEKVQNILANILNVADKDSIQMDTNIKEDLGADSIDVIDITYAIEEEFDMEIPDDVIGGMKYVSDIVKFIEKQDTAN